METICTNPDCTNPGPHKTPMDKDSEAKKLPKLCPYCRSQVRSTTKEEDTNSTEGDQTKQGEERSSRGKIILKLYFKLYRNPRNETCGFESIETSFAFLWGKPVH